MYKITFYSPVTHTDAIKNALFSAGAGKIGNYACCAWQTEGTGQFMPLAGSHAFIGEQDNLEKVTEHKVELVCDDHCIHEAIAALKQAHPYETPAYHVFRLEDF